MASDALSREEAERRAADVLAELARLRRVEAAARAVAPPVDAFRGVWWMYTGRDMYGRRQYACIACTRWSYGGSAAVPHAPDCAAMALDAALADDPGGTA